MRQRHAVRFLAILALAIGLTPHPRAAFAASAAELNAAAETALQKLYAETPAARSYGDKAKGILVFPKITKAGLVVGGAGGDGVLMIDGKPAGYYSSAAGSIGLQAGYEEFSTAMMFMTDEALTKFRDSSGWEVGVDAGVTVIDKGAEGTLTTENVGKDPVVAFIFGQEGLMAGVSLKGAKISKIEGMQP
jgi:lipid-binding SYLF domain-containing protein